MFYGVDFAEHTDIIHFHDFFAMIKKSSGMDKKRIEETFWVTPKPKQKCPEFLRQYGLWIFSWHMDYTAPPGPPGVRRYYEFYSFSHMHGGKGWFASENAPTVEVSPGDAVLVGPGFRHGYRGLDDNYIEDSVSFFGPVADQMAQAGMIPNAVFQLGRDRRLLPIIELVRDPSLASQYRANIMLQQLIVEAFLSRRHENAGGRNSRLDQLIAKINAAPSHWWTVDELADSSGLSKSHFRRIFHAHTGMNPKEYILNSKINYAANLLISSGRSVQDVAAEVGFSDPFHFSRVFKSLIGLSPSGYIHQFSPVPQPESGC